MNAKEKIRFLGRIRTEKAKGSLRRVLVTIPRSISRMLGSEEEIDGMEVYITIEKRE